MQAPRDRAGGAGRRPRPRRPPRLARAVPLPRHPPPRPVRPAHPALTASFPGTIGPRLAGQLCRTTFRPPRVLPGEPAADDREVGPAEAVERHRGEPDLGQRRWIAAEDHLGGSRPHPAVQRHTRAVAPSGEQRPRRRPGRHPAEVRHAVEGHGHVAAPRALDRVPASCGGRAPSTSRGSRGRRRPSSARVSGDRRRACGRRVRGASSKSRFLVSTIMRSRGLTEHASSGSSAWVAMMNEPIGTTRRWEPRHEHVARPRSSRAGRHGPPTTPRSVVSW